MLFEEEQLKRFISDLTPDSQLGSARFLLFLDVFGTTPCSRIVPSI